MDRVGLEGQAETFFKKNERNTRNCGFFVIFIIFVYSMYILVDATIFGRAVKCVTSPLFFLRQFILFCLKFESLCFSTVELYLGCFWRGMIDERKGNFWFFFLYQVYFYCPLVFGELIQLYLRSWRCMIDESKRVFVILFQYQVYFYRRF